MSPEKHFMRYWLPVIVWCTVIFVQSAFAVPDVGPHWPHMDKVAHLGIYGLLAILLSRAFNTLADWHDRPWKLMLTAAVLTVLYGLSDEWHQSYVPARTCEAADLLADLIGGVIGGGLFLFIQRMHRRSHLGK